MRYKTKTHTLVMTALMAALLAVLSPFTIPIGPIPFSLALFAVFLTGAMLPPMPALAAVGVYVLLGVVGLPVFSGFGAGPGVLLGPTGGYLAGYFLIALGTSLGRAHFQNYAVQLGLALAGMLGCYLLGTLWFMAVTGSSFLRGLAVCVAPFALPDCAKAALALGLARLLDKRLKGVRQG